MMLNLRKMIFLCIKFKFNSTDKKMKDNNIIAMDKFNDKEAFVLKNPIELKYKRYGDTIIGTDGFFVDSLRYEKVPSHHSQAFAGRQFQIKLENGDIVKCAGDWWDQITEKTIEILGSNIIATTAGTIEDLKRCYVFCGYYGIRNKIKEFRESYKDKIYGYWEYSKILGCSVPEHLLKKEMEKKS